MIALAEIEAARARIAGVALRTPLLRLHLKDAPAEIYLKLENLQPIGSFKIRGALNAILSAPVAERQGGLVTASAGNMAQGVAWAARQLGRTARIVVPEHAPHAKSGRSSGWAAKSTACPTTSGGRRSLRAAPRASRAYSCTRCRTLR